MTKIKQPFSLLKARPSGQALAEFAQVAAVFFLFIFGIIEMALVVYQYTTTCQAARDAARYAIAHSPTSANPDDGSFDGAKAVATNDAPFLSAGEVAVSFPNDPNPKISGQKDALVTITHTYSLYIPVLNYFTSATNPLSLTLSSSSQMLVSQ